MIPFNRALYLPKAAEYVTETLKSSKIAGDGKYTKLCTEWMEKRFQAKKILLTTSCTAALEMSAILLNIRPGDEVILSSYTFVTTANAFVLRGAKAVFVDIRPDTMNTDEINDGRRKSWNSYYKKLKQRYDGRQFLKEQGVDVVFHYVPLHSSPGGQKFGCFIGEDCYAIKESSRLFRLPMWYGLTSKETDFVVGKLSDAFIWDQTGEE